MKVKGLREYVALQRKWFGWKTEKESKSLHSDDENNKHRICSSNKQCHVDIICRVTYFHFLAIYCKRFSTQTVHPKKFSMQGSRCCCGVLGIRIH